MKLEVTNLLWNVIFPSLLTVDESAIRLDLAVIKLIPHAASQNDNRRPVAGRFIKVH